MSESISHEGPSLAFSPETPPLRVDLGGVVRVGQSRISLDLIVEQYENGMTPDEIVLAYDVLSTVDVYGAIFYYLRHQDEVWDYIAHRQQAADAMQAMFEMNPRRITRKELLARRKARERANAPSGQ